MRAPARLALVSVLALGCAAPFARAQAQALVVPSAPTPASLSASSVLPAGPAVQSASVGVHRQVTARDSSAAPSRGGAGMGQPEAMMIVGGAALIVGAIVGDTPGEIIMIGGAIIGLVGLYKYLQ